MSAPELLQSAFRYALALSHHPEDAEDLVQEAWMNLRRKYGCVESRAVLFAAVRNLFIDQCRRRKIVQFESLDDFTAYDTPAEQAEEPGVKGDLDARSSRCCARRNAKLSSSTTTRATPPRRSGNSPVSRAILS